MKKKTTYQPHAFALAGTLRESRDPLALKKYVWLFLGMLTLVLVIFILPESGPSVSTHGYSPRTTYSSTGAITNEKVAVKARAMILEMVLVISSVLLWTGLGKSSATRLHFDLPASWPVPRLRDSRTPSPRKAHEAATRVQLVRRAQNEDAPLLRGPWTGREGVMYTCEIDVLYPSQKGPDNWHSLYEVSQWVVVDMVDAAKERVAIPFFRSEAAYCGYPPVIQHLGERPRLDIRHDRERSTHSQVVESDSGVEGLPACVQATFAALGLSEEMTKLSHEKAPARIRVYETVVTERDPVVFLGDWYGMRNKASTTVDGAATAAAVNDAARQTLFLGTYEELVRWGWKRQSMVWLLRGQVAVAIVLFLYIFGLCRNWF